LKIAQNIVMLYVIHAYDHTDEAALGRRMAVRPAHFEGVAKLKEQGFYVLGGALLDPEGGMIGSMMLLDFPSEVELQEWLKIEPYANSEVWDKIDIKPFRKAQM
jgi:uncharacterized protein YciI